MPSCLLHGAASSGTIPSSRSFDSSVAGRGAALSEVQRADTIVWLAAEAPPNLTGKFQGSHRLVSRLFAVTLFAASVVVCLNLLQRCWHLSSRYAGRLGPDAH
jgi:hypothetical protein